MDQFNINLLKNAFIKISSLIRFGNQINLAEKNNSLNQSGDFVKKLDLLSHQIIVQQISKSPNIVGYISEESSDIIFTNYRQNLESLESLEDYSDERYIIAFDPLDGSSNIDSNITTGTIFAIYQYDAQKNTLTDIVFSGYCLYGPATILVMNDENLNVNMYQLNQNNEFDFLKKLDFNEIESEKVYSVNESYFNLFDSETKNLVLKYKENNYNHRYIGSMVSDCHRVFIQGGLFMYPKNDKKPNGKIRLLYEALPFAFLFLNANGFASSEVKNEKNLVKKYFEPNGINLDENDIHMTTPIFLSSELLLLV